MPRLSFVDQGPVSAEYGPAQTLRHTVELARLAEQIGYTRYWLAEHHGVNHMGIAAPEILIGHIADRTSRMRVGSGGMMLPNHSLLHLAEQFRTLETLYPGRIDLGIGRSTGTGDDPTKNALLRSPSSPGEFARQLRQLLGVCGRGELDPDDPYASVFASPQDAVLPPAFVLGSSIGSAEVAASAGLGYAFLAVNQDPSVAIAALRGYRTRFACRPGGRAPYSIIACRTWVGADDEHARALASSERLAVLDHLAGTPRALEPAEKAVARQLTDAQRSLEQTIDYRTDVVGSTRTVAAKIAELVAATGADEVMAISNVHDPADRQDCLRRLAIAAEVSPSPVT